MHYGIIGLGPVGGVFASLLSEAGAEVSVLDSNTYKMEHLKDHPLVVKGAIAAEVQLKNLYTDMGQFVASQPDVILLCTKSSYSRAILSQLKCQMADRDTVFVSCQNGIDVEDLICDVFGNHRTLRMILNFGANYVSHSEIAVAFNFTHFLSKKPECCHVDVQLQKDLTLANMTVELIDNYKEAAFKKSILNSAAGAVCAITRLTMKEAMEEQEISKMIKEIVREAIKVGLALGYDIGDYYEPAIAYMAQGGNHKPSILVDIEKQRPTENEFHCGKLFKYAEEKGIDVPVTQTTYYLIKNLERSIMLEGYVAH